MLGLTQSNTFTFPHIILLSLLSIYFLWKKKNVGIVIVSLKLIKVNFKIQILYKLTNKTKKEIGKKKSISNKTNSCKYKTTITALTK